MKLINDLIFEPMDIVRGYLSRIEGMLISRDKIMGLFTKKKPEVKTYDKENCRAVLRCSICTGEKVAGFKNIHTGKFEEVTLIRDEKELEEFRKSYGISEITKEY